MKTRVELSEIAELLPQARRYEGYVSGLCPYHDDHSPSLMAYADGWFRCLACGHTGSNETLVRKLKGWDASRNLRERVEWRPPRLPKDRDLIEVFALDAHRALRDFDQFRWYIEQRGLAGRIEPNRLGWYEGWYTLPVFAPDHTFRGIVLRAGSHIQKATGQRFYQPLGQPPMMYCPDWHLFHESKALAVVFGMFDALTLAELRFPVVTSTLGKDSFQADWLAAHRKPVYVIPDLGEEETALKLAGSLGWRGHVLHLDYPAGCKDANDFLRNNYRSQLIQQLGGVIQ